MNGDREHSHTTRHNETHNRTGTAVDKPPGTAAAATPPRAKPGLRAKRRSCTTTDGVKTQQPPTHDDDGCLSRQRQVRGGAPDAYTGTQLYRWEPTALQHLQRCGPHTLKSCTCGQAAVGVCSQGRSSVAFIRGLPCLTDGQPHVDWSNMPRTQTHKRWESTLATTNTPSRRKA